MVSNLDGNLREITKRRLMALSHYKFRMKLKIMAIKFGCNIIETDEYLTSKTCSKSATRTCKSFTLFFDGNTTKDEELQRFKAFFKKNDVCFSRENSKST